MKTKIFSSVLALVALLGAAAVTVPSAARSDDYGGYRDRDRGRFGYDDYRYDGRRHPAWGFKMGVCVGQALAQAGVTLPAEQPGTAPSPDPTTEAAFKAAIQQCRAQFNGTSASPTPVSTATPAPTDVPVTDPTPTPSASSSS
jgi:hypothetical protein